MFAERMATGKTRMLVDIDDSNLLRLRISETEKTVLDILDEVDRKEIERIRKGMEERMKGKKKTAKDDPGGSPGKMVQYVSGNSSGCSFTYLSMNSERYLNGYGTTVSRP